MKFYRRSTFSAVVAMVTAQALLTGCTTTSFRCTVRTGNVSKVEKHIEEGVDLNSWQLGELLTLAVGRGNVQTARLLIQAGAEIDIRGGSPLGIAAEADNVEMAQLLIESGANVNIASHWDNTELIRPNTTLMASPLPHTGLSTAATARNLRI